MEEISKIVLYFILYSFVGWLWETIFCSIKAEHFVYRGFLVGPYCPIYGFGVLGVLYFLEPYRNDWLVLYVFSAILVSILEYVTSYVLEKLFHATWWDYEDVPFNINGRIALPVSLFWGIGCVFIVKVVQPIFRDFAAFISVHIGSWLPFAILFIMFIDLIYTVTNMASFKKRVALLSDALSAKKDEFGQRAEQLQSSLTENIEQLREAGGDWLSDFHKNRENLKSFPKLNFNQRRLIRNYSRLHLKDIQNGEDIKDLIKNWRKKKS